jgi:ChrR Cupin-like domain
LYFFYLDLHLSFALGQSKFPKHTHIGGEEFVVLEGTFKDQYGEFPAGTYVRNPIGSEHEPWVDADGCTIMVKLLQMADPTPNEGSAPLHIHIDQAKNELGKSVEYGTVAELYTNDLTGEVVEMCWLNPNAVFIADSKCLGGEELFIVSGSLHMGNHDEDIYHRWGWLRFPPTGNSERGNPQRKFLQAGSLGAQAFRKTGHLTDHALSLEKIQINDEETSTIIS